MYSDVGKAVSQERTKLTFLHRNAALRVAAGGGQVEKDGRAASRLGWVIIPAHHNTEIVDMVLAPESLT